MDAFLSPWEKSNPAHLFFPAVQIPIILVIWMLAHSALLYFKDGLSGVYSAF